MKLVCISDTHNKHERINLPDGDVLVHAGDFTMGGMLEEVKKFARWYGTRPHAKKILIAGNHDLGFQSDDAQIFRDVIRDNGIAYLQDQAYTLNGVKFYGSPWQPEFYNWAFNLPRGPALAAVWSRIPDDTQVLITHGPPLGILDRNEFGNPCGCDQLAQRLTVLPRLTHIFGHIHEGYGCHDYDRHRYVNASTCDGKYRAINTPIEISI